jgi:hypothetical protein
MKTLSQDMQRLGWKQLETSRMFNICNYHKKWLTKCATLGSVTRGDRFTQR